MNRTGAFPSYKRAGALFTRRHRVFAVVFALFAAVLLDSSRAHGIVIVALGDSLTAGYGLPPADAFPVQLEKALKARGVVARIVNAGVSGDTTAGGRARLEWALADKPDLVIVELGGNDALRGIDPQVTHDNLDAILTRLNERGITTLLAGMRAPPNYGADYVAAFDAIFPKLAAKHGVALFPFFLDGVAAKPELNQNDGIHPNRAGVALIVERIVPAILPLVTR